MPNKQSTITGMETAEGIGIRCVSKVLTPTMFTDSTTTGTYTWSSALPAGSFYIGCKAVVDVGFNEDTSAVMTVGKTAGEDEFSDGASLNVFTAASVGQEGEAPLEYLASATDVVLRITTATDFTLVYAGSGRMTLNLYYLSTVPE